MKFNVGDNVAWRSSNTDKTGVIVKIVPPGGWANSYAETLGFWIDAGGSRKHESYIIRGRKVGTKRTATYWPVVSLLRAAPEAAGAWAKKTTDLPAIQTQEP